LSDLSSLKHSQDSVMKKAGTLALAVVWLIVPAVHAQEARPVVPRSTTEVRAAFSKLLDRPRVPLDPKIHESKPVAPGLISERLDFAVETRQDGTTERVPTLILRPDSAKTLVKRPAVIVLHGTGGTKEGNRSWLEQLAGRGFVAVAIDGRYHGARSGGLPVTKAYNDAILQAWRTKPGEPQPHPLYFDTCWDIWRTIDYLQSRPEVDPERIGLIGFSKGGIETWLAGAVDQRIKVAVPAISVQSFRWSLDNDRWQARANTVKEAHIAAATDLGESKLDARVCRELWSKVMPGILDEFDAPSLLRLFAGRSLLILNGEKDPNCPIEGAELAFAAARKAFHDAGADDHLKIMVAAGAGHTVTREQHDAALEWFVKWLKPDIGLAAP
jgi:dienelactone hydrolase